MQDLLNSLEAAVKSVVDAGALGIATFLGQDAHTQERPSVTIYAEQGEQRPINSGNFMVTVMVQVRSSASDTTIQEHRETCRDVFALIQCEGIEETLSGYENLTVFPPLVNVQCNQTREDDSWLSELRFDAYCCPSDLAA